MGILTTHNKVYSSCGSGATRWWKFSLRLQFYLSSPLGRARQTQHSQDCRAFRSLPVQLSTSPRPKNTFKVAACSERGCRRPFPWAYPTQAAGSGWKRSTWSFSTFFAKKAVVGPTKASFRVKGCLMRPIQLSAEKAAAISKHGASTFYPQSPARRDACEPNSSRC